MMFKRGGEGGGGKDQRPFSPCVNVKKHLNWWRSSSFTRVPPTADNNNNNYKIRYKRYKYHNRNNAITRVLKQNKDCPA